MSRSRRWRFRLSLRNDLVFGIRAGHRLCSPTPLSMTSRTICRTRFRSFHSCEAGSIAFRSSRGAQLSTEGLRSAAIAPAQARGAVPLQPRRIHVLGARRGPPRRRTRQTVRAGGVALGRRRLHSARWGEFFSRFFVDRAARPRTWCASETEIPRLQRRPAAILALTNRSGIAMWGSMVTRFRARLRDFLKSQAKRRPLP